MAKVVDEFLDIFADVALDEEYSEIDQYRDFREVFLNSDKGRKVLKLILTWAHIAKQHPTGFPVDQNNIMLSEGQRNLALRILSTMLKEPRERPDKQNVRSSDDAVT
jgi:hypothetical protein